MTAVAAMVGFARTLRAAGIAAGPERVNPSAIERSLRPACTKNAGTLGIPTSSV